MSNAVCQHSSSASVIAIGSVPIEIGIIGANIILVT